MFFDLDQGNNQAINNPNTSRKSHRLQNYN